MLMDSLLTIVIPTKNSLYDVKKTVESLLNQTKIRNITILIADFGSDDGTRQYISYASSEYIKLVKIEPLNYKELNDPMLKIMDSIRTKYTLFISPGIELKNLDFIFDSMNLILSSDKSFLFYEKKFNQGIHIMLKNWCDNLFFKSEIKKIKSSFRIFMCKTYMSSKIDINESNEFLLDEPKDYIINKSLSNFTQ
jgi:glycosyltransferase involved in cell wall biosynthesis